MYGKRKALFLLILPLIILVIVFVLLLIRRESLNNVNLTGTVLDETDVPDGWKRLCTGSEFSAILEQEDCIWAGGRDGVYKFGKEAVELAGSLEQAGNLTYVRGLVADDENRLYIASQEGLAIYDGDSIRFVTTKDGLPDNRVNCIMKDNEGAIWVGTWGGAAVFRNGRWEIINKANGLCNDMVNVMLQDRTGSIWFGSYAVKDGGISCLKDGKWFCFNRSKGVPNENITCLYEDASGGVWCGTGFLYEGGACRFVYRDGKPELEKVVMKTDGLAGEKVRSIFEDSTGILWFCSEYDGAALFKNGKSFLLNVNDGLSDPEIKAGITDDAGNLWLAARRGITFISANALEGLKNRLN